MQNTCSRENRKKGKRRECERESELVINLPQLAGSGRWRVSKLFLDVKERGERWLTNPCDCLLLFKSTCHEAGQSRCDTSKPFLPHLHTHTHILCIIIVEWHSKRVCVRTILGVCAFLHNRNTTRRQKQQQSCENDGEKDM